MEKKILVVDNHPLILKLMSVFLAKEGHEVLTAEDGLSALEILKVFVPDYIFVDLIMPHISGEKLCRTIRSLPGMENVRIIILSAVTAEKEIDFKQLGADACIAKGPFTEVAKHVAALLTNMDKGNRKNLPTEIMGLEGVHHREITKELLSAREHFEAIIDNMAEGVLEITMEGRIIFLNSMAATLLGAPEEKLLAADFREFFNGPNHERLLTLLAMTTDGPQIAPEDNPLILNGRQLTFQLLPLQNEKARTVIVIFRDVTDHKQMEERLRRAQKLEAIGTLAGGIAHDLNNILQPITGYAQLTLRDLSRESGHREYLEQIVISVKRAADLINQILTFSRHSDPERRLVHLAPLVKEISKLLRGFLPSTIEIREEIEPGYGLVFADVSQIHQVIMNMATNGYHAMREKGGVLTLRLEETAEPPESMPGKNLSVNGYARLTIADTGHGMSREIMERIFEPYFTTKELGEGTGLGLATVHAIVNAHGGGIRVHSVPGQGTRFEISFPITHSGKEKKKKIRSLICSRS